MHTKSIAALVWEQGPDLTKAVTVLPLSAYSLTPPGLGGLLLGYAAVDAQEMPGVVARLATAIREMRAT